MSGFKQQSFNTSLRCHAQLEEEFSVSSLPSFKPRRDGKAHVLIAGVSVGPICRDHRAVHFQRA
jgi:hypothetical protein